MIELTLDKAIELAKSFVEPNPEFVYKDEEGKSGLGANCHYIHYADTDDEKPGCIVGYMFDALGVERSTLKNFDDNARTVTQAMNLLKMDDVMTVEYGAYSFLDQLQTGQDAGRSWEVSLQGALECVGRGNKS